MRNATPEQKAKAAERRAQMRAIAKRISLMPLPERVALAQRIPVTTIEGRALSMFNCCMVAMQNPTATIVGGFRQWIKAGRAVKKGEHGAAIWFPLGDKKNDAATERCGIQVEVTEANEIRFGLATIFDVSQTQEIEMAVAA